jgi:hypothetical protein
MLPRERITRRYQYTRSSSAVSTAAVSDLESQRRRDERAVVPFSQNVLFSVSPAQWLSILIWFRQTQPLLQVEDQDEMSNFDLNVMFQMYQASRFQSGEFEIRFVTGHESTDDVIGDLDADITRLGGTLNVNRTTNAPLSNHNQAFFSVHPQRAALALQHEHRFFPVWRRDSIPVGPTFSVPYEFFSSTNLQHAPASSTIGVNAQRLKEMNQDNDIPEKFLCEITQEIMSNPVRDKNHPQYVFEEASILKAMRGRAVNPYTNTPLVAEDLVPDKALQREINYYMAAVVEAHQQLTNCFRY